jgi:xanthine dehydrogenase small subunit
MDKLQFVFNNIITEIDFCKGEFSPTTTVLKYLRSLHGYRGVKEGCGEGDCGACTVVIANKNGNSLQYKAVASCLIFLPMIHGQQLITIEDLKDKTGELHAVQQAMIQHYGSQCGYCTPGFVMSMLAEYKNKDEHKSEDIVKALSGNLCRCTGYKPILEAAGSVFSDKQEDHFCANENEIISLLDKIDTSQTLEIHTEKQVYIKPGTLTDALNFRNIYRKAILISGSTDIALRVTKKNELLSEIIDLSGIPELKFIKEENSKICIGAATSIEEIHDNTKLQLPALANMLSWFGSKQIRNIASLGGNVGSASPIGDSLPVLIAYQANIILRNSNKQRKIRIGDFITDYRKTDIQPDEIIYAIEIPIPDPQVKIRSYKVSKRRELDISTVSACFRLELNEATGKINDIVLAYGGMAATPSRAKNAEKYFKDKKWDQDAVDQAMKIVREEFTPLSDARSGNEFRKIVAANLLQAFFNDTKTQN